MYSNSKSILENYKYTKSMINDYQIQLDNLQLDLGCNAISYSEQIQSGKTSDITANTATLLATNTIALTTKKRYLETILERLDSACILMLNEEEKAIVKQRFIIGDTWINVSRSFHTTNIFYKADTIYKKLDTIICSKFVVI